VAPSRSGGIGALVLAVVLVQTSVAAAAPPVEERDLLGTSYEGRPIRVFHEGDPQEIRVLVVGSIHGDEPAGIRIATRLLAGRPRRSVDLWVVKNLNPDGRATGTRQNARGVDLNRNFPFGWEPGPRGRYYPGRRRCPSASRGSRRA
jgi:murein tripeptide amidase MpaA